MDKILKIVHIITRLIVGGAQENTLITCRLLAQRGHDVTLITGPSTGPEGELFEKANNENYNVEIIDELIRPIRPLTDFAAYKKLKKKLKELKPDIIHTHSAKAGIIGRFAGCAIKDSMGKPFVVHGIHGLAFHSYQSNLLNKFYIAIEKAAAKRTDFFVSVADAMTRQALDAGIGTPDKFVTAYSAIEEANFLNRPDELQIKAFRQKHNITQDAVVLVTVARLFELKGHDFIIESAKRLAPKFKNAIWLFVGGGNLEEKLKKDIEEAGLSGRFRFTGLVPPDQIPLILYSSDILVHCSLREGLARAIPQAMLCGKPAVAFDLDGSREVVNENTGRLIEAENIEQLIAASAELIENQRLRQRLGETAKESVMKKFAPDTMVDTIEQVYNRLTAGIL
ncbi:MAG: glycosyltransferase [Phycisphaerae bacterium]|nr:glycosyltransferase [Phycisphaerae bacterium]